ncbi:MAG: asparagine synthetase B, partial [Thermoleophilia bacterium]|nr:asparagine synthetase B [Thermoleophilia bacterium]
MPGIIGFVRPASRGEAEHLLGRMALALEPEARFRHDLYSEDGLGLGRLSLGLVNPGAQPVWNAERSLAMVMEGEIYQEPEPIRRLKASGESLGAGPDAEVLLRLFEEAGDGFVADLNGAFSLALWERKNRTLRLASDRLGLQPLYYVEIPGGLLFGSGVRALLADPGVPRTIDRTAIAEFLTFDHMLRDRTLLQAVRLLPQGTILTWRDGRISLRQYWKPAFRATHPVRRESDYSHELLDHLRTAVKRQERKQPRAALLLSGGLDSRTLLAVLAEQEGRPGLRTLTWGIPGCDDARSAAECARLAHVEHHFFELPRDWLLHLGWEAVRVTDGMGNVVNLHAIAPLKAETEYASARYKGFLGDAMFGFGERPRYWAN